MVVIDGAFTADMNAQKLASVLTEWLKRDLDGYFKLTYSSDDGQTKRTVSLRPINSEQISTLANQAEHIVCETPEGERIGLLVPRPGVRLYYPVVVLTNPRV